MERSGETLWSSAQEVLKAMLNTEIYNLWFAPVQAGVLNDESITLQVPNDFCGVWLKDNYHGMIRDAVASRAGVALDVKYIVRNGAPQPLVMAPAAEPPVDPKTKMVRHEKPVITPVSKEAEFTFNPNNTFDTFVVGNNNILAHGAAVAVAQTPGKSYNPLFLYGGVGLGKTHLLHAIGQYVQGHKKAAKVAYISSERFTNEFIEAIQSSQVAKFRKKYRQMDVLLIDDIQFLAGKERIQEEFFHTFNALHESHKQIVLTCDRPASEIQNLEQRLVSRFEWGLVTDMQPPDVETRLAILKNKEKMMGVELPPAILELLANRIRTNIRRLEGALIRVISFTKLTGQPLTVDSVEGLLHEVLHEEGRYTINIETIQKRVAEHFDIRLADMTSRRRPENIAFPRQIAMYLARQMTESSLNTIGEAFGGRDHGTVLHACRLVKDRMEVDTSVRKTVGHLEKLLLR